MKRILRSSAAPNSRSGRPAIVLLVWVVLLGVFASIAPLVQSVFAVPFELISLVMFAPALACIVVLFWPKWLPASWHSAALTQVLGSVVVAVLAVIVFIASLALLSGQSFTWPPATAGAPLVIFLVLQASGVLCEEIGWRGLVQLSGEQFARPSIISAIAGFLFGATHLGYWSLGVLPVLTFATTAMLMSLTITTIFVGSFWQRMIPAVTVHLGVNLGVASLMFAGQPLATTPPATLAAGMMLLIAVVGRWIIARQSTTG